MRTTAALSLLALLSGIRTTAAGTCAPRARLAGDTEAVAKVAAELHRLGVATEPAPAGCRAIEAAVELDRGGGIAVAIRDAARRTEGRILGDAIVAAAWIDSWVRDDLAGFDDGLGAPSQTAPSSPAITAMPPLHDTVERPPASPGTALLDRISLRASYLKSWTSDGASWDGIGVAGCVRMGFACVGLRAQAAWQPQLATNQTAASRSDYAVYGTASTTIALGRIAITPELALGIGRFATSRVDGCKNAMPPPNCDPNDPTGPGCMSTQPDPATCIDASGTVFVGDHYEASTIAPRAGAALRIAIPLFDHVWLDGEAGITVMPIRHAEPYPPPKPTGTAPPPAPADQLALPGEPLAAFHLGIGLRIGAP